MITRCVGANVDVTPDVYSGTLRVGDVYLLASDGLTGMIEDEDLMGLMERVREPQRLADELVDEANRRGGLDNVTVIVIRVDGTRDATHGE